MSDSGLIQRNGQPHIDSIEPAYALPGGEIKLVGHSLAPRDLQRPRVQFGDSSAPVVIGSEGFVVARVPTEGPSSIVPVRLTDAPATSAWYAWPCPLPRTCTPSPTPRSTTRAISTSLSPQPADKKRPSRSTRLTPTTA